MTFRILIVDDHTLVRQGIVKLLADNKNIEVVGEAANGFEAVTKARDLKPEVILMDLYMPGLDGVAATRLVKRELPEVEVVILTASDNEEDLFEALQAGARGYILKDVDTNAFARQLNQVCSGGVGMTEELTSKLVSGLARRGPGTFSQDHPRYESLTKRETEVLATIAKGLTNKAIASELYITENTVRAHVRTLMQKLQMENRTQLAVYGVHEGYTVTTRQPMASGIGSIDR